MFVTEEDFLNLFKMTDRSVDPGKFLTQIDTLVDREKRKSFNAGADYVLKSWRRSEDERGEMLKSIDFL